MPVGTVIDGNAPPRHHQPEEPWLTPDKLCPWFQYRWHNGTFVITKNRQRQLSRYPVSGPGNGTSGTALRHVPATTTATIIRNAPRWLVGQLRRRCLTAGIGHVSAPPRTARSPWSRCPRRRRSPIRYPATEAQQRPGHYGGGDARATTSIAHGYANGDSVTVAGASCSPRRAVSTTGRSQFRTKRRTRSTTRTRRQARCPPRASAA